MLWWDTWCGFGNASLVLLDGGKLRKHGTGFRSILCTAANIKGSLYRSYCLFVSDSREIVHWVSVRAELLQIMPHEPDRTAKTLHGKADMTFMGKITTYSHNRVEIISSKECNAFSPSTGCPPSLLYKYAVTVDCFVQLNEN